MRWETLALDIGGLETEQALINAVYGLAESTLAGAGGRSVVTRLVLTGRGPMHRSLRRTGMADDILEQLNKQYASARPWLWCEGIRMATASLVDRAQVAQRQDFAGDLARRKRGVPGSPEGLDELQASLQVLYSGSRTGRYLRGHLPSDNELMELLAAAEDDCLAALVDEEDEGMRLEELLLDGFGHFHQRTIGPIARAVTVFYGPNEAGKSTLLAFIRTILFGFPARGRNEHYPPSSGGRHGGRIRLSDDDGAIYTLERYTGTRGGPATVLTEAGETLDAETTLRRLTGQATPDLFNNVFAFSIDELQEVKTLTDSQRQRHHLQRRTGRSQAARINQIASRTQS